MLKPLEKHSLSVSGVLLECHSIFLCPSSLPPPSPLPPLPPSLPPPFLSLSSLSPFLSLTLSLSPQFLPPPPLSSPGIGPVESLEAEALSSTELRVTWEV